MRSPPLLAALAVALVSSAGVARAQVGGFAMNQFEPAPAGDAFFGVPSPGASGHIVPRALLMFDYASRPVRLVDAGDETPIVSSQAFLRLNASLALWNRLQVSLDIPLTVAQAGEDPGLAGITFTPLEAPQLGDVRIGARVRVIGDDPGPFQVGMGGYLFLPTGNQSQYTGEGAVRGALLAMLGGQTRGDTAFVWTASGGVEIHGQGGPATFTAGAGVGLILGAGLLQLGPEVYLSRPFAGDLQLSTTEGEISTPARANAELLGGAKLRVLRGLVFGAAAGPGIVTGVGTPTLRAIATLGWAPSGEAQPEADPQGAQVKITGDRDNDGINDDIDACPDVQGQPSPDPAKDGCPPGDRDGDGVTDQDDACPTIPGQRSSDITKSGCPGDTDGDGFHDGVDACKTTIGVASDDPAKNGCPPDGDNDGIADASDACPTAAGAHSPDPRFNGCPEDPDGDGIKFGADACPTEKGVPDPDPKLSGCKKFVRVTQDEIITSKPIQFISNGRERWATVHPISDEILYEVRDAIQQDPSIQLVEVQGHTDDEGDEKYNLQLSQERADAVRSWLIRAGVPEAKLTAKGYGFEKPLADNRIRTGRQKNRRVQFIIVKRAGK